MEAGIAILIDTNSYSPIVREYGFRNRGKFCVWNSESWALESEIQLKESGIPLRVEQNPSSTDKRL